LFDYLPHISFFGVHAIITLLLIPYILQVKRDPTVAIAWCLIVILLPVAGALLFWAFGINYLRRQVQKTRAQRTARSFPDAVLPAGEIGYPALAKFALAANAFPVSDGNQITLYHETTKAFTALLETIRSANHHIHLEFFILRPDETGRILYALLTEKAKAGVEVRLLYDSLGTLSFTHRRFWEMIQAGAKVWPFLSVNPFRSLIRINLRNHRKITVVDGKIGFTGGMNIGDEYLGKDPAFGYWRDTFLKVEGPAVAGLQRVFAEDWDFAAKEPLVGEKYFPALAQAGQDVVQVVESGPDQVDNSIREIYFAAILGAEKRLWIASPYFVPDNGIQDALKLARRRGVDVRLLTISRPDHKVSFYAGRYYFTEMLAAGVKIYLYKPGMMHSKNIMVDGRWAIAGSANLDNRSLQLNFEIGCMLHSQRLIHDLENHFEEDLTQAELLDAKRFDARSFSSRLAENACRLFSPVL
jgi:cardiolipin synthase